ncbi:MAG: long-chain fatty acid--CoA ligase [Actinomycetota bacterium]|nr:long-chain fatty acid--CoA ligase [Actinomycetota bacterium]
MREYTSPVPLDVPPDADLTDIVFEVAGQTPDFVLFLRPAPSGSGWEEVSARQFLSEVLHAAKGLVACGVAPGDRVGLMSKTRYEWALLDFAVWCAGAVSVPLYETSSPAQVQWALADSGAVAAVVETDEHAATLASVRESLPALRQVWTLDRAGVQDLVDAGRAVPEDEIPARRAELGSSSVATVIYTSGTTGEPKGCELTHGNFLAEVRGAIAWVPEVFSARDPAALLFLPLAHVLARAVQLMCVAGRVRIAHTADARNLLPDLAEVRPTFLLVVPRVLEKVYNASEQRAQAGGKGRIFAAAAATSIAYSRALDSGRPGPMLRLRHALFDRLVYGKLRAALGGRVGHAISGGGPLGERLGHFYRGVGLSVLEGYGLTETTAASNVNTPRATRIGTVGKPLPGNAVRIADDGEVLLKGPVVFGGYAGNEAATREAFTSDGWLRTGDLGNLDDEGFLRITGRSKEILVTAGGKNVAPAVLEDRLRAHPLISQCMVVGDGRPYVAALVTLDEETLPGWLAARGRTVQPPADLVEDPDVLAAVQGAIDDANARVSRAESIKRFRILPVDFTQEGGELTPTLKLKRRRVLDRFADEVEALYS